MGAVPGPFDAWLTLRGIKTLAVRMERHCANARAIVELLTGHPAVGEVLYPGLPQAPGHAVAARQMRDFGGMVSFRLRAGEAAALDVCRRTRLFTLAESLGGVESLIEHPRPDDARQRRGQRAGGAGGSGAALGRDRGRRRPRRRSGSRRSADALTWCARWAQALGRELQVALPGVVSRSVGRALDHAAKAVQDQDDVGLTDAGRQRLVAVTRRRRAR